MVKNQIAARGINDAGTLASMRKVERHRFVPDHQVEFAYEDRPLPIGERQTISQPYIVAFMTEVIKPDKKDRILEIGTGSGYQAAVLAEIVKDVYTIEIIPALADIVENRFDQLGYKNIHLRRGDGYEGWPEYAPFDAVVVTAAIEEIPQPLIDQLAEGGRIIIPVGPQHQLQHLILGTKKKGKLKIQKLFPVRFVPFTREE